MFICLCIFVYAVYLRLLIDTHKYTAQRGEAQLRFLEVTASHRAVSIVGKSLTYCKTRRPSAYQK